MKALEQVAEAISCLAAGDYAGAGRHFAAAAAWGTLGAAVSMGAGYADRGLEHSGSAAGAGGRGGYEERRESGRDDGYLPPQTLAAGVGGRFSQLRIAVFGSDQEAQGWVCDTLNAGVNSGRTVTATYSQRGAPVGH